MTDEEVAKKIIVEHYALLFDLKVTLSMLRFDKLSGIDFDRLTKHKLDSLQEAAHDLGVSNVG